MNGLDFNHQYTNGLNRIYYRITAAYNAMNACNDLSVLTKKYTVFEDDFVAQCYFALYNDTIANVINVIVPNRDSFTYHNLKKKNENRIREILKQKNVKDDFISSFIPKIKLLRDKYIFHIDKKYLMNPDKAWEEANIIRSEFKELVEILYLIIKTLYLESDTQLCINPEYENKTALKFIEEYLRHN